MSKNLKTFNSYAMICLFFCLIIVSLCYFSFDKSLAKWIYVNNIQKIPAFYRLIYIPNIALFLISLGVIAIFIINKVNLNSLKKNKFTLSIIAMAWSSYLSLLLVKIFKFICGRIGPRYWVNNFDWTSYGFHPFHGYQVMYQTFPSGHSAVSFAIVAVLFYSYPKLGPLSILVSLIVIVSLLFTQNHYLSDCIAGSFLGFIIGLLTAHFFQLNKVEY